MARGTANKVILIGRLGADPERRATASGTTVVNLNLATNELGPKQGHNDREVLTEWHRIVLFGQVAENAAEYLRKGDQAYFEGRIQTRRWTDGAGVEQFRTEVVANQVQFLGKAGGSQNASSGQGAGSGRYAQPGPRTPQAQTASHGSGGFGPQGGGPAQAPANNFDDFDDDIPF